MDNLSAAHVMKASRTTRILHEAFWPIKIKLKRPDAFSTSHSSLGKTTALYNAPRYRVSMADLNITTALCLRFAAFARRTLFIQYSSWPTRWSPFIFHWWRGRLDRPTRGSIIQFTLSIVNHGPCKANHVSSI